MKKLLILQVLLGVFIFSCGDDNNRSEDAGELDAGSDPGSATATATATDSVVVTGSDTGTGTGVDTGGGTGGVEDSDSLVETGTATDTDTGGSSDTGADDAGETDSNSDTAGGTGTATDGTDTASETESDAGPDADVDGGGDGGADDGGDGSADPCAGVDCGDHGDCVSPLGTCECDPGYSGADCSVPPSNEPIISDLTASPNPVGPYNMTTITFDITDWNGDDVDWEVILTNGSDSTLTNPSEGTCDTTTHCSGTIVGGSGSLSIVMGTGFNATTATVTVTANDNNDGTDTADLEITVI